jgi:microsomal epoxide hydrolase
MNTQRIAILFAALMTDVLGDRRFGAQGGDWGACITSRLGFAYPDQVVGIHLSMVAVPPSH